jgi:hypothetical protein
LVFGTLVAKRLRIIQFLKTKHNLIRFSDFALLKIVLGIFFGWIVFLAIARFTYLYQSISMIVYDQLSGKTHLGFPIKHYYHQCKMGFLDDIKFAVQGICLLIGFYVLLITRRVEAPFQESKWMYL